MILILVWIDVGELETSPRDLSMLSDVVKNDVVTNAKYNKLIKTINAI